MMANVAFAVRGDSLTARYAPGGATPTTLNRAIQTNASGTGIIGAGYIDLDQGANVIQALQYPGKGNIPTGNKFSILIRCAFGVNNQLLALWGLGAYPQLGNSGGYYDNAGAIIEFFENYSNASDIANNSVSWTPVVGQYYDIVFVCNMSSTGASNLKIYVDGVLLGSNNGAVWPNPRNVNHLSVMLGTTAFVGGSTTRIKVNEFVIWDDIIDPTGTGLNLNGQSRSAFVSCSVLDGSLYSDPGIANVRSGTAYTIAGSALTGTAAIPAAADVRSGTAVDAGTGTLAVPTAAQTKHGVAVDGSTGTYRGADLWDPVPPEDVIEGLGYLSDGVSKTGLYRDVTASNVLAGVLYGWNGTTQRTGTFDPTNGYTDPGIANVRAGVSYRYGNFNGNNRTGTLDVPTAAQTKHGVAVDGSTGTYRGADLWTAVTAGNLRAGVSTLQDGSTVIGTLDSVTNVLAGVDMSAPSQAAILEAVQS
jgi:hypothetical protein